MDKRTRQRIIGIVLLLLLAAVLAPFVFRSPEQIRNALDMQIPDQPEMTAVNVEPVVSEEMESAAEERIQSEREAVKEAAQEQLRAETDSAGESAADAREGSQAAPVIEDAPVPPPVKPDDSPVLAGFVVQVGSYSSADNAAGVVDKLKSTRRMPSESVSSWRMTVVLASRGWCGFMHPDSCRPPGVSMGKCPCLC